MPKSARSTHSGHHKTILSRQSYREILEKVWTLMVILGLLAFVGYTIVIQILHHP